MVFINWKKVAVFILIFVVPFLVIFGLYELQKKSFSSYPTKNLNIPTVTSSDWLYGSASAPAQLIEYGDLECPACAFYAQFLRKMVDQFDGKLVLVYRHFPLKDIHKNAVIAALAAESAGEQGKFWEMLEKIYASQDEWNKADERKAEEIFLSYAQALGLDEKKFKADMHSSFLRQKIEQSYEEAISLNLSYTPTFVLNGKVIDNPRNYEQFVKVIQDVLSKTQ